jgi:hypothetical protein
VRVLVACEFTGTVRDAFLRHGHDAVSADLLPTEVPGPHHHGDVRDILDDGWDLMVAHPPCTHLARSGSRWWKDRRTEQDEALDFVRTLMAADIPRIAIENPIGAIGPHIRKPDQIIHPWWFGHGEVKATCLWLKGLKRLNSTDPVDGRDERIHRMPPSPTRSQDRSRTYPGMAEAMAAQWGSTMDIHPPYPPRGVRRRMRPDLSWLKEEDARAHI